MFGWLKRRRLWQEHERKKEQALKELRQMVAMAKERNIDISETPPLNRDELEAYCRAFFGTPDDEEIALDYKQQWYVLRLRAHLY